MARVYTYFIISIALALVLNAAGVPTGVSAILDYVGLGDGGTIGTSTFFLAVGAIFAGVGLGGILIGFITDTPRESYIIATLCSGLMIFAGTFVSVINYVGGLNEPWLSTLVSLVFAPIALGYILSLVEFWRGTA